MYSHSRSRSNGVRWVVNPLDLPIYREKERILAAVAANQVVVVQSPTGSGKTTQIPQILLAAGFAKDKMIGVTQPRRIAAVSVAQFIARQLGTRIPELVGYKMRFEDRTDPGTRIKIMTDGILLQEIKADYSLSRYGVIMVDEAHERSLNIDFILGLLKQLLAERPGFKVIVSSATINAEVFSEYFDECPIVTIESSPFPVQMRYEPPRQAGSPEALLDKIAEIVERTVPASLPGSAPASLPASAPASLPGSAQGPAAEGAEPGEAGDILIFLPGEGGIKNCLTRLESLPCARRLAVLPLYSRLSSEEQERVFDAYPGRVKVIAATNIAETSVTIDGVTTVIDTGLAKVNYYNNQNFTSSLIEVPVSKASANQRRGRSGRTRPGVCYRLYTRQDYEARALFSTEEIHRTDLSEVVLRMAELGIRDFERFDFISPPGRPGILSAIETLQALEALDAERELTSIGRQMLAFPVLPKFSRILVEALLRYPQVLEEALVAASFLSSRSPFILPPGQELEARKAHHAFRDPLGDFLSYLKVYTGFQSARDRERFCERNFLDPRTMGEIENIKAQLGEILAEQGIPVGSGGDPADYLCAVARGLIQFVCVRTERGVYRTSTAGRIQIHPGSVMYRENPRFIVAGEIVRTSRMYAHSVSPLAHEWLGRIFPALPRALAAEQRGGRAKPGRAQPGRDAGEAGEAGAEPAVRGAKPGRDAGEAGERATKRDFTSNIRIGSEVFQLAAEAGRGKIVMLPWDKIRPLVSRKDLAILPGFRKMKGKVLFEGFELLGGMRLSTILRILPRIDPARGILERPGESPFRLPAVPADFSERLRELLRPCHLKKRASKLGFVSLLTDAHGAYWFKGSRNYLTALKESLYSLETLADAPEVPDRDEINALYRTLSRELEEL
jgi:HrpA-like RNA helicase